LHTGGAQTRSTPQISGTLCLSSIVQRQHLQHTAAKVRVPVVPGTGMGMGMGFNGPGLAGPRAGGVLQVGSVRAGEGAGVIGWIDAAGVLRHGLFSPKAEGRRPNPLAHAPPPGGIAVDVSALFPRSGFVQPLAQTQRQRQTTGRGTRHAARGTRHAAYFALAFEGILPSSPAWLKL
jgi:hypothetical protein